MNEIVETPTAYRFYLPKTYKNRAIKNDGQILSCQSYDKLFSTDQRGQGLDSKFLFST